MMVYIHSTLKYWSKLPQKKISVPHPNPLANYNSAMEGVKLLNQSKKIYKYLSKK